MMNLWLVAIIEYPTPLSDFEPSVKMCKNSGLSEVKLGGVAILRLVANLVFSHGGNLVPQPNLRVSHSGRRSLVFFFF